MGGSEAPDSISFNWGKVAATNRITGHQYPKSTHTPPSDFLFFCLLFGQALPVEAVSFILVTLSSLALVLNFKCFMVHTPNVALIIVLFIYQGPELSCWQFQTWIQLNDGLTYNPHCPLGNIHICASISQKAIKNKLLSRDKERTFQLIFLSHDIFCRVSVETQNFFIYSQTLVTLPAQRDIHTHISSLQQWLNIQYMTDYLASSWATELL